MGTDTVEARNNWTGRLGVRRRLDDRFDFGLAYSGIVSSHSNRSPTSDFPVVLIFPGLISSPITSAVGGLAVEARTKARQHIADFDLGYDLPIGAADSLKVIGGARFTQFLQTTNLGIANAFFPAQAEFSHRRKDEFIGAGPRLAFQGSHPLNSSFTLNAGVGGSILFGQQKIRASTDGVGGLATGAFDETHGRIVYNGEGEASLAYSFTINAYAAIGYQASAWFGLRDNRRELDAAATLAQGPNPTVFLSGGRRYAIDLTHGPFVRAGFRW